MDALIEAGHIQTSALKGNIPIPVGPVVEEGEYNHKRYSLRTNPPLDLSIVAIEEYLSKLMRVQEIIIENKAHSSIPIGGL